MSPEELLKISRNIVEKTRNTLFVGSSNVHDDVEKTGGWTHTLLNSQRQQLEWRKRDNKWNAQEVRGHLLNSGNLPVDSLGQNAVYAAHAYLSKSGNCGEMTNISLYFLSLLLKEHNFEREKIEIATMALPDPYNHVLIKMTVKGSPDQAVYIDPWMGISYLEKDFEENMSLTAKKLIEEDSLTQEMTAPPTRYRANAVEDSEGLPSREKLKPSSLFQMELINSSTSCAYYVKIFETEFHRQATAESSSYFTDLLKKAIKQHDYRVIPTLIAQGARVDSEITQMAFAANNTPVIEKILTYLKDSSKLKIMYFERVFESAKNTPDIERVKELKLEILKYRQEQLFKKNDLLTKVDKSQQPTINAFFESVFKDILETIQNTEQHIASQQALSNSTEEMKKSAH